MTAGRGAAGEASEMPEKVVWTVRAGLAITFEVRGQDSPWDEAPGLFLFCKKGPDGGYLPVYVGQAEDKGACPAGHPKWGPAWALGATVVLAAPIRKREDREAWVRMLVREYRPELNDKFEVTADDTGGADI